MIVETTANEPAPAKPTPAVEPPLVLSLFVEPPIGAQRQETDGACDSACYNQCDNCWTQCDCLSCHK